MKASAFSTKFIKLAAKERKTFAFTGKFFRVLETNLPFNVAFVGEKTGKGESISIDIGIEYKLEKDDFFTSVEIFNPNTSELQTIVCFGVGQVTDNRLNVLPTRPNQFVQFGEAKTLIKSETNSGIYLTQSTPIFFARPEMQDSTILRRKDFIISNPNSNIKLYVKSSTPNSGFVVVFPRTTVTITTDVGLYVWAESNLEGIEFYVMQVCYIKESIIMP